MEKVLCCTCFKPKAALTCGLCAEPLCKYCAQFLQEDSFKYLILKAPEIQKDTFCGPCYDAQIAMHVTKYEETLARAKNILIFSKIENKETRYIKRDEERLHIPECDDREEIIMRLAFQAAERNFNGVIDIEIDSRKIRTGTYQTTKWWGSGIPAHVNPDKLIKDRSFSSYSGSNI
jgi:hypothetical protein